jgi:hypothetical protein
MAVANSFRVFAAPLGIRHQQPLPIHCTRVLPQGFGGRLRTLGSARRSWCSKRFCLDAGGVDRLGSCKRKWEKNLACSVDGGVWVYIGAHLGLPNGNPGVQLSSQWPLQANLPFGMRSLNRLVDAVPCWRLQATYGQCYGHVSASPPDPSFRTPGPVIRNTVMPQSRPLSYFLWRARGWLQACMRPAGEQIDPGSGAPVIL